MWIARLDQPVVTSWPPDTAPIVSVTRVGLVIPTRSPLTTEKPDGSGHRRRNAAIHVLLSEAKDSPKAIFVRIPLRAGALRSGNLRSE